MADGVSSTEIPFQPEAHWSVPWLLADRIARSGDHPLVARKSPLSGDWQEVSARAFGEEVAHVAAGLIGMGLEAGTAVGIMAHTSYDWFLLDMAIARAGLISVPIYETSSAEQVEWIVTDSDVRVVITESGTLAELVRGAVAGIEQPVRVLALDSDAITTIVQAGSGVSPSQVDQRTNALKVDDVYSIIYTSGTTGRPKGVELTHRNAVGIPYHGVRYLPGVLWGGDVRLLLFLPLAHVYARCLQLLSLAGEEMSALAQSRASCETSSRAARYARSAFDAMTTEVALGQYLDILAEQHPLDPQRADALSADAALEVALHKSAHYSVVHPGVLGAICGAPSLAQALPLIEVLETILTPWGLAFQLRDDDLGVFGDPAVTGKPAGDDLREGKRTVLLALTWAASSPAERTALTEVLGVAEASAEQIARATAIVERNGRGAHEAEIARLVEEGHRALDASHVDADAASMLRELCDILTTRRA